MKTKKIEWAYPTSPSADKFRFAKGCWVVQTVEGHAPPVALAGYTERQDAVKHAEQMAEPWNPLYLKFHPETK